MEGGVFVKNYLDLGLFGSTERIGRGNLIKFMFGSRGREGYLMVYKLFWPPSFPSKFSLNGRVAKRGLRGNLLPSK